MAEHKILIVAAPGDAAELQERLHAGGWARSAAVGCGRDAVAAAANARFELALIDVGLGGEVGGIDAARQLRSRFDVPVLFLTGDEPESVLQRSRAADPFGYVGKSCAAAHLRLNVDAALAAHRREVGLRQAERDLRQELESLRDQTTLMETVFNSISEGLIAVDRDGRYLVHNPAMERIVGTYVPDAPFSQRAETYGLYRADGVTPFPSDELPLARAARGEASNDVEVFIRNARRPEGVYVSINARPMYDRAGALHGGVILFRDVSRIKKVEAELQEAAHEMRAQATAMETIFNSISDGVVVADTDGRFSLFNPSAERMVGVGMTDAGPEEWTERYGIFFPDRVTPVPTDELPLMRAIQGEAVDDVELFIRNPNIPEGAYISVNGRPLRDTQSASRAAASSPSGT